MSHQKTIEIAWVVWEADAERLAGKLTAGGSVQPVQSWEPPPDKVEIFGDSQLDPLTIIAATISIGWLVGEIWNLLDDWRKPEGLVIDAREKPPLFYPDPRMGRGTLVIIPSTGGIQVFGPRERDRGLKTLQGIFGGN
jgi:hypothetical protein